MANKVLVKVEGLAVPATFAAVLAKDTLVKISANETVAKAGSGETILGHVVKSPTAANGIGTVETRFRSIIEIIADGILAAGDEVKLSSDDGSGNQRVKKFVEQVIDGGGNVTTEPDSSAKRFGRVWKGGADAATVKVLVY